ncbi:histidine--tRNA ligase [Candidatus Collierbacteria bacterium RIFCSPHIGHO2_01_FULL_50_25]|uniref:Histidine--tRNA ligase n=1 Tax=Candidatus Collierbacteria bacterium RIFCSPHIGHO2_01_FULL_50_25 TaxID=1817722 RepID=A0A1F5EY17_9BACT|nr:MAG: histidine--tRNA ligase [Candidatus Collierbacteria bacterium RIFCSPHIGHO2_01_FULL_50_25]
MAQNKIQTLKGFRDFLPEQAKKRQWLTRRIEAVFELWGYDPLETPTLEPLELFAGQIGEEEQLFFKFEDNAGRQVALRYDQTVPTCRVVGQYAQVLPMPFRRYQIQPVFRAEKPQKGRYREFTQCDADIFGVASPLADAEVIALSLDIYRRLGFPNALVLVNDRSLLSDLPYKAIVAIDKLEKIGEAGVITEMIAKGIDETTAREYLIKVRALTPNETIRIIFDYLDKSGFDSSWYKFEPTLARSFSYSTGPIWEVKIPGFDSGSVLGGERYDQLVERVSGINVSGTGFGLGFDRTLEAAEQLGLIPSFKTGSQVLICTLGKDNLNLSLILTSALRDNGGVNTEIYPDPEAKLDKQLKYANKKGIPFVAILGENEIKNQTVTVKNMASGEQTSLPLDKPDELAAYVQTPPVQ